MYIYEFTVEATRDRFLEPPLHDTIKDYIAAYSYDQAHSYIWARLNKAGWKVQRISSKEIFLTDIRDTCDHTTD